MRSITLNLKRLGKKKIYSIPIQIEHTISTLEDLIIEFVNNQVNSFNKERKSNPVLSFLTPKNIQEQSESGKVGFNEISNISKADFIQSKNAAIQAFKDGLFLVFIDDNEVTDLNQKIELLPESTITLLRMTFLAGTFF